MKRHIPRILLTAPASGSGKTLITCGILQALVNRGMKVASFKCGPDYIDPMFHGRVIGTRSRNLDTFFTDTETTRYLFAENASDCDIAVTEGVMGYYDGLGGIRTEGSTYDVAAALAIPAVLIVSCRGASLSILAMIKGFLEYRPDSRIKAVILNQISPMIYGQLKPLIEEELGVKVLGYVPKLTDLNLESRHLGLVTPQEMENLQEKVRQAGEILAKTVDLELLEKIAGEAAVWKTEVIEESEMVGNLKSKNDPVRIAVARDEAFCFYYKDNLELLESLGCEVIEFSPLHDKKLPENVKGILLGGGYPELYGKELAENQGMLESIRRALDDKIPCLAECGGFMYLHEEMEDADGNVWKLVGRIHGKTFPTGKLVRFGYVNLQRNLDEDQISELKERMSIADSWILPGENIRAHEFHYWDSTDSGSDCLAVKPDGKRKWECIHMEENFVAGYPHLYYPSCKEFAERFVEKCRSGYRE